MIWGTETVAARCLPAARAARLVRAVALSGVSCLFLVFGVFVFKRAEPAFARIL